MTTPQEIDMEQVEQENAIWPWLADGSMEDQDAGNTDPPEDEEW